MRAAQSGAHTLGGAAAETNLVLSVTHISAQDSETCVQLTERHVVGNFATQMAEL